MCVDAVMLPSRDRLLVAIIEQRGRQSDSRRAGSHRTPLSLSTRSAEKTFRLGLRVLHRDSGGSLGWRAVGEPGSHRCLPLDVSEKRVLSAASDRAGNRQTC